jgi:hypothetical protein
MPVTRKTLSVVTGTYNKDGQEKNNYMTVGNLIKTDTSEFIELNPYVNFTALPRKEGRLLISIFEEKTSQAAAPTPAKSSGVTEDIPF